MLGRGPSIRLLRHVIGRPVSMGRSMLRWLLGAHWGTVGRSMWRSLLHNCNQHVCLNNLHFLMIYKPLFIVNIRVKNSNQESTTRNKLTGSRSHLHGRRASGRRKERRIYMRGWPLREALRRSAYPWGPLHRRRASRRTLHWWWPLREPLLHRGSVPIGAHSRGSWRRALLGHSGGLPLGWALKLTRKSYINSLDLVIDQNKNPAKLNGTVL